MSFFVSQKSHSSGGSGSGSGGVSECGSDDDTILEGQLDKEGRIAKAYKPRWFVLTPTSLMYYTDSTKSVHKESMYLTTHSLISPVEVQVSLSKNNEKHKFSATGVDCNAEPVTMTMMSEDASAANTWIERIHEVKRMNSLENIVAFKKGGDHLDTTATATTTATTTTTTTTTGGANSKDSQISSIDSTSLKFQKYLASHLSSCSIGQDVIASVVDEGTRHIINAFIMAIRRFAGETEALQVKENCFKVVTKLAILYSNKVLLKEDFVVFSTFSDNLTLNLSRTLMQLEDSGTDGTTELLEPRRKNVQKHITRLSTQFNHLRIQSESILPKYMKESNVRRVAYVTDIISAEDFLMCLLVDENYDDVRSTLKDLLYSSP